MDSLFEVRIKFDQWFREEDFLNLVMYFCYLVIISSWEKAWSFKQTSTPFSQVCFALSLVEIGPVVQEEKVVKFPQYIFAIF